MLATSFEWQGNRYPANVTIMGRISAARPALGSGGSVWLLKYNYIETDHCSSIGLEKRRELGQKLREWRNQPIIQALNIGVLVEFGVINLLSTHGAKTLFVRAWPAKKTFLNLLLAMTARLLDKGRTQFLGSSEQLIFIQFPRLAFCSIARSFSPGIWASNSFLLQCAT